MNENNSPPILEEEVKTFLQNIGKCILNYTHGATFQMTLIFIVNAVIISILTPGRSRKTPNDNGTAVHSNTEGHDSTSDTNTAEVR
jgi:hypothetical protein